VNTDTPDHKSHVAYPVQGNHDSTPDGGVCPDTHPVKIPQVMLETIWDVRIAGFSPGLSQCSRCTSASSESGLLTPAQTTPFNDKEIWPEDGSQPFVWSTNDK
jgi:hypothetical protein